MRRFARGRRRRAPLGRTARVRLFFALLALTLCAVWVSWRLEPVLQDLTEHEATACVTQLVASAAEGALLEAELPQGSPVSIQYGDDGAISSLTTDTARLNSLRAFVLERVQQELGERASVDLGGAARFPARRAIPERPRPRSAGARHVFRHCDGGI